MSFFHNLYTYKKCKQAHYIYKLLRDIKSRSIPFKSFRQSMNPFRIINASETPATYLLYEDDLNIFMNMK